MGEFELIRNYFAAAPCAQAGDGVALGIGDDCALLALPAGEQLAISTDTLVAGVHFADPCDPFLLGQRSLAVAVSDLAAMGAHPLAFTLALTTPTVDADWLQRYAQGLNAMAQNCGVGLVGGDTTRGPLNLCITVFGEVPPGRALRRDAAQAGDDLWISGRTGEARLALAQAARESARARCSGGLACPPSHLATLSARHHHHSPPGQHSTKPARHPSMVRSESHQQLAWHLPKKSQIVQGLDDQCLDDAVRWALGIQVGIDQFMPRRIGRRNGHLIAAKGVGRNGCAVHPAQAARIELAHAVRHRTLAGKHHALGGGNPRRVRGDEDVVAGGHMLDRLCDRAQVAHAVIDDGHGGHRLDSLFNGKAAAGRSREKEEIRARPWSKGSCRRRDRRAPPPCAAHARRP